MSVVDLERLKRVLTKKGMTIITSFSVENEGVAFMEVRNSCGRRFILDMGRGRSVDKSAKMLYPVPKIEFELIVSSVPDTTHIFYSHFVTVKSSKANPENKSEVTLMCYHTHKYGTSQKQENFDVLSNDTSDETRVIGDNEESDDDLCITPQNPSELKFEDTDGDALQDGELKLYHNTPNVVNKNLYNTNLQEEAFFRGSVGEVLPCIELKKVLRENVEAIISNKMEEISKEQTHRRETMTKDVNELWNKSRETMTDRRKTLSEERASIQESLSRMRSGYAKAKKENKEKVAEHITKAEQLLVTYDEMIQRLDNALYESLKYLGNV